MNDEEYLETLHGRVVKPVREIPMTFQEWNKVGVPAEKSVTVADLINDLLVAANVHEHDIANAMGYLQHNAHHRLQRKVYMYIKSENITPGTVMQSEEDGNVYILEP